jgi:exodeoxyribonuclease VII small subunit
MNKTKEPIQNKKLSVDELPYEKALAELETIVSALETENNSLEESLLLYERGQALAKRCIDLLDQAELKISQITNNQTIPLTQSE